MRKFISLLEKEGELKRIRIFTDPVLEISEFADRAINSGGPALLFENNGTQFPVLINAFGSDKRMNLALRTDSLKNINNDIEKISKALLPRSDKLLDKIHGFYNLMLLTKYMPVRIRRKGKCQKIIHRNPDLGILPVMKCWPYDGGRFITLPVVHTFDPFTRIPNAGMYRMQILDSRTTAMHWQLHKTGANHFRRWKESGKIMPVSVVLGGDPVYSYAATAPLPENVDEYILAGFLRKRRVKMVKCITNDIYVPDDADIIIEGFVDPSEPPVPEGPFGDHTGFYSLTDYYPKFHVTCITHSRNAVYPATVVGIPPKEDLFFAKATEKIFLKPLQIVMNHEITDMHLPPAGVAHNLVLVTIKKSYPGQGLKVVSSLLGTGQMMFTKYIVVLSDGINIRDYGKVLEAVFRNCHFKNDVVFTRGPLDVLDHSCDIPSFGGKMGFDATEKLPSEKLSYEIKNTKEDFPEIPGEFLEKLNMLISRNIITAYSFVDDQKSLPVLIIAVRRNNNTVRIGDVATRLRENGVADCFRLVLAVDQEVDIKNWLMVAWQVLGNSDPERDHLYLSEDSILIDGTIKTYRPGGFGRPWPEIVCSDMETISKIDRKWTQAIAGSFVKSPSLTYMRLKRGNNEIIPV